jgi:hypothetical protein
MACEYVPCLILLVVVCFISVTPSCCKFDFHLLRDVLTLHGYWNCSDIYYPSLITFLSHSHSFNIDFQANLKLCLISDYHCGNNVTIIFV